MEMCECTISSWGYNFAAHETDAIDKHIKTETLHVDITLPLLYWIQNGVSRLRLFSNLKDRLECNGHVLADILSTDRIDHRTIVYQDENDLPPLCRSDLRRRYNFIGCSVLEYNSHAIGYF